MVPLLPGLLAAILAPAILSLAATQATAQAPRRDFSCVGAERLEDDVFAIPFRSGNAQVTEAARSGLAAAAQLIKAEPDRDVCVLGHSDREGGQTSNVRLAASRARAVAEALTAQYGIPAGRLRSEARVAGFSRSTENRNQRNVTIVVLPARAPTPEPAPKPQTAPQPAPQPVPQPAPQTKPETPAAPPADSRSPASQPPASQPAAPAKPPAEKQEVPKPTAEPKPGSPESRPESEKPAATPPAAAGDGATPPADEKKPNRPGTNEAPKPAP
ncbi:OmpA family protein [Roseomonas gilardii]|uniref:OmpA family protein n=1 Tax=Roseomonas gilardii TaxID=257708 RepID=A0ABU3MDD3_9PROT|nr:OmpA family protein [Roseomonas gilardii]MDT8330938.1 OmpA family protein [Roseomonas gilardii]